MKTHNFFDRPKIFFSFNLRCLVPGKKLPKKKNMQVGSQHGSFRETLHKLLVNFVPWTSINIAEPQLTKISKIQASLHKPIHKHQQKTFFFSTVSWISFLTDLIKLTLCCKITTELSLTWKHLYSTSITINYVNYHFRLFCNNKKIPYLDELHIKFQLNLNYVDQSYQPVTKG